MQDEHPDYGALKLANMFHQSLFRPFVGNKTNEEKFKKDLAKSPVDKASYEQALEDRNKIWRKFNELKYEKPLSLLDHEKTGAAETETGLADEWQLNQMANLYSHDKMQYYKQIKEYTPEQRKQILGLILQKKRESLARKVEKLKTTKLTTE